MSEPLILAGNNLETLKELPDGCVDSVVTDPPYGLSFMGKKWDYEVPTIELWREVFRVLKPGGHLLSFGGTRTYHRLVVNIEDAGFEIRDQIQWIYGSGFPKSQNVSLAIDKQAGAVREVIGVNPSSRPNSKMKGSRGFDGDLKSDSGAGEQMLTAPATEAAKQWQGWGTALKPANEPICVARKPLAPKHTVAQNVQAFGTGALNIDTSRIGTEVRTYSINGAIKGGNFGNQASQPSDERDMATAVGRWPANILFDEDAAAALDLQTQHLHGAGSKRNAEDGSHAGGETLFGKIGGPAMRFGDSGGASRFFYVAKASKAERNKGLEGMPEIRVKAFEGGDIASAKTPDSPGGKRTAQNFHPTVKPVKLMEYLVRLVTPPGGVVLDPFMGSGTTGVACKNLDFEFIGCEMTPEYVEIAKKRMGAV